MARQRRIEYYGAIYHIIHRGNNKEFIFKAKEEKLELLNILGEVKEIFDFHLLAYVIMGNHYHFIIRTHNIPISQIMHRINTRYAKYYNWKKDRTGSPFEGRYRGILVQNQSYFLRLIKYIHNNPVYANICNSMTDYKWSSDIFYRMNIGNMVDIDELLDMFSLDRQSAIEKYKELMGEPPEEYDELKKEFEDEDILGTEEFKESFLEEEHKEEKVSLDEILRSLCPTDLEFNLIKEGSRKRYLGKYKSQYAKEALKYGYTMIELSDNINVTHGAMRKILQ